ncbi:hypothetical protein, partial [Serratia ficaria]|uniref:hypothetical protein n=1 Tax=Serratia ficaria TaxID=61651 RepID=UPI0021C835CE
MRITADFLKKRPKKTSAEAEAFWSWSTQSGVILPHPPPPCQDSCRLELKNFRGPETTKMNTYSPERKAALIARMMPPHNQSVVQLA